ncbi:hypothetical protein [Streptomyces hydrogenans]|uniref:hypothetical protein n=1 Tax=Streptomyces hydrogenans TaxID=1873719 RepID=UPI0037F52A50
MSTPTAADDLITALAHQGVTAHRIHEIFIGGDRNSWLVVTPAGRAILTWTIPMS